MPGRDVWADLVGGLLDARSDPATARFDADLAASVADGSVAPEVAHRLRYWQRASVRLLADHARTVLPVALGALEAARAEAEKYVQEAADALAAAEPEAETDVPDEPDAQPADEPAEEPTAAEPPVSAAPDVVTLPETPRRASAPERGRPSTLEERRPRLLVAGLTTAPAYPDRTS
jgi:hypothetical protein